MPQDLGLKPCGTGGYAASLSRRRGALKLQLGGRGREDINRTIWNKNHLFSQAYVKSFRMNVDGSIWAHLAPDLLSSGPFLAILYNAYVPRRCAKFVSLVNYCATNANRCSDPTLKQFTSLRIQIFTLNKIIFTITIEIINVAYYDSTK